MNHQLNADEHPSEIRSSQFFSTPIFKLQYLSKVIYYRILFLCLVQKQARIWGCCFSLIVGFRSPNFAQRNTLVYWNRKNLHFEVWEKKYRKMESWPLGNESSPFCRTEWFHINIKTEFIHLSVWLIGQGGWKLHHRPRFYSWQFETQAEKCCWAGTWNF